MIASKYVCLDGPCKYGWKVPLEGNICTETCAVWVYNLEESEGRCVNKCLHPTIANNDGQCVTCAEIDTNAPLYAEGKCVD